jgi:class 3 adenylate cyclase
MIQSLDLDMMVRFAKQILPGYDIRRRLGISERIPVSNHTAAQKIIQDIDQEGRFIDFVEFLISADASGYMGRRFPLRGLDDAISAVINEGYTYDKNSGQFFENHRERMSPNWGRLKEGDEKQMTVMRLDIAGNSVLVKNNPSSKINEAYEALRIIVTRAVTTRLGRVWSWEGDGALAVFYFGPKEKSVVFCGMEILHELWFYNKLSNPLSGPIKLRLGIHTGKIRYSENSMERLKNETVREAVKLEEAIPNDSMGVSYNLYITMDHASLRLFSPEKAWSGSKYRIYQAGIEKS